MRYHPEASAEFDAAVERYESLSVGLVESFVDEMEARVASEPFRVRVVAA